MAKKIFTFFLVVLPLMVWAQNKVATTDKFSVEGKIKQPFEFSLNDVENFKSQTIDSVVITNHLMERRSTIKNIKGILLKDVLSKMEIDAESPKVMSEFYLTCVATDYYKVVFSWNELFNSETGNHVLIITEKDGKKAEATDDRILLISPTDRATGRRYVKGLQKIIVSRTN